MGMFDEPSAKRHTLWSNEQKLIQAVMDRAHRMSPGKMSTLKPLCKYYMDALGVKRRIGKRDELKASQILDQHIVCTHAPRQDPLRRRPLETRIACRNTTSELRNYTRSFGEFLAGAFLHLRSVPLLQLYIVWVQYDIIVLLDI